METDRFRNLEEATVLHLTTRRRLRLVLAALALAVVSLMAPRVAAASPALPVASSDGEWRSLFPHWPVGVTGAFMQDPVHDRALLVAPHEVWQIASGDPLTWVLLGTTVGTSPMDGIGTSYSYLVYDSNDDRIIDIVAAYAPGTPQIWELPLATLTWHQLASTGGVSDWFGFSTIFDPDHDRIIMYAGYNQPYPGGGPPTYTPLARTYQIALGANTAIWTIAADPGPTKARIGQSAVADPARHHMVVFGGNPNDVLVCDYSNPTLAWSFPTVAGTPPSYRNGADMLFDPTRDCVLLYGGYPGIDFVNDLYRLTLDGTWTWSPVVVAGTPPSVLYNNGIFYDSVGDRMVKRAADTEDAMWAVNFGGTPTWTNLSLPHPLHGGDEGGVAAIDVPGHRLIVTGDWNTNDSWELPLSPPVAWNKLAPPTTPSPLRVPAASVFDPARRRLVLFGGARMTSPYGRLNDVWALDLSADTWSQILPTGTPPPPRILSAGIYDPLRDRMIVFGGTAVYKTNDVWALSLAGAPDWAQILPTGTPPIEQEDASAVYDPVRDRMLIFSYSTPSVWALSLSGTPAWQQLPSSPVARLFPVYDPVRDRVLALDVATGTTYALSLGATPAWSVLDVTGYIHRGGTIIHLNYDAASDEVIACGPGLTGSAFALSFGPALGVPPVAEAGLALSSGWPNPARDHTTFRFSLERPAATTLSIHDVSGRLVRTWTRTAPAGASSLEWDLTTQQGSRVRPGVFLLSLDVAGQRLVRRFAVVR